MKILSIILSIYITAISFLPCGDVDDCKDEFSKEKAFSELEHTDHQEDTETCSPFCICACCGANVIFNFTFPSYISKKQSNLFFQKIKIKYSDVSFMYSFSRNIWQPPRFA